MDLKAIETFIRVARYASFSKAALDLSVSQATVSNRIKRLEVEIGAPLFHRGKSRISLTEHGHRLLPKAESMLDAYAAMMAPIDVKGEQSALPIGTNSTSALLLPEVIEGFNKDPRSPTPPTVVSVIVDSTPSLMMRLMDGEIDIALANPALCHPDSRVLWSFESQLIVACPSSLESLPTAPLRSDLPGSRFIAFTVGPARDVLNHLRTKVRAPIDIVVETNSASLAAELVGLGVGMCILPIASIRHLIRQGKVIALDIPETQDRRWEVVSVHWRSRPLSDSARRFVSVLRDERGGGRASQSSAKF